MTLSAPVAVIGGSGFIGGLLIDRLVREGADVRNVDTTAGDPAGAPWVHCDICDREALLGALDGVRTVFNLAAAHGLETHPPAAYQRLNVEGAGVLCEVAASVGVERMIFTSTAAVYGEITGPDETAACTPSGGYAVSKLAAEAIYGAWAQEDERRRLTIVRPTVVFGPGADGAGDRLIRHVADPDFVLVAGGQNRKSLAFGGNLAAFLAFVAERGEAHGLFNYCDAPDLTLAEIATAVRGALGLPDAPTRTRARTYAAATGASVAGRMGGASRPGLRAVRKSVRRVSRDLRFDATRAHSTGFVQPVPLEEALVRTALADLGWMVLRKRAKGGRSVSG